MDHDLDIDLFNLDQEDYHDHMTKAYNRIKQRRYQRTKQLNKKQI